MQADAKTEQSKDTPPTCHAPSRTSSVKVTGKRKHPLLRSEAGKLGTSDDGSPAKSDAVCSNKAFYEGSRVEGRNMATSLGAAGTSWYPAIVSVVHPDGSYDLHYDDEEDELHVLPRFVRIPKTKAGLLAPPLHDLMQVDGRQHKQVAAGASVTRSVSAASSAFRSGCQAPEVGAVAPDVGTSVPFSLLYAPTEACATKWKVHRARPEQDALAVFWSERPSSPAPTEVHETENEMSDLDET